MMEKGVDAGSDSHANEFNLCMGCLYPVANGGHIVDFSNRGKINSKIVQPISKCGNSNSVSEKKISLTPSPISHVMKIGQINKFLRMFPKGEVGSIFIFGGRLYKIDAITQTTLTDVLKDSLAGYGAENEETFKLMWNRTYISYPFDDPKVRERTLYSHSITEIDPKKEYAMNKPI